MDLGSIFLILALLTLVALFVGRPFFDRSAVQRDEQADQQDHEISTLLAERDRVLNALQELDFDYSMGKIPDEDYPAQRAMMLKYGAEVLRTLDTQLAAAQPSAELPSQAAEDRIEAAIAARRASSAPAYAAANGNSKVISEDDDLEV
ncbi:MAG: hypothetical protein EHM70_17355, partial [Chloroflexota bacterium]